MADLNEKIVYSETIGHLQFLPYLGTDASEPEKYPYRKRQCYRAMLNHDAVKAPLLSKVYSITSLELNTTPASDTARDGEIADFVKYQFTDAIEGEFQQVAESILLPAFLIKNSINEKVWYKEGDKWTAPGGLWPSGKFAGKRFYRTFKAKENAEIVEDDFNNIVAIKGQDIDGEETEFDPQDFVIFKHLPLFEDLGTADLEAVYDLVWKLDTVEKIHNLHLHKFTSPAVVASYGPSVQKIKDPKTGKEISIQKNLEPNLASFGSRNWLIVPEAVKVESMQLATRGEAEFAAKCDELRQRIALAITGAYLQLMADKGTDIRGNASGAKNSAELLIWNGAARLAAVLNTQAVPYLVSHNYVNAPFPKINLGGINYEELKRALEIDEGGSRLGVPLSLRAMARKYNWQIAQTPEDTLRPPGMIPALGMPGSGGLFPMPAVANGNGQAGGQPNGQAAGGEPPPAPTSANGQPAGPIPSPASAAAEGDLQAAALNGTQIDSLMAIIDKLKARQYDPPGAIAIIRTAFPLLKPEAVADLVNKNLPAPGTPAPISPAGAPPGGGAQPTFRGAEPVTTPQIKPEQTAGPGADLAIGGPDGEKAEKLLEASLKQGAAKLRELTRAALLRKLKAGRAALGSQSFFDRKQLEELAEQIAATNAAAELLGRVRIQERAQKVLAANGSLKNFSQQKNTFHVFAADTLEPMTPEKALDFFKNLVPELSIDPKRWGNLLQRTAFTLAAATDEIILAKVKGVIEGRLATGENFREAVKEIDKILDDAGVGSTNPQYAEMVFRTNMADSYNSGAEAEGLELAETFPVWKYSNPSDGRSRKEHKEKNGLYFSNAKGTTFSIIRGTEIENVANCRCTPIFIDKWEWQELQAAGARLAA